jgi:hypothetical protein
LGPNHKSKNFSENIVSGGIPSQMTCQSPPFLFDSVCGFGGCDFGDGKGDFIWAIGHQLCPMGQKQLMMGRKWARRNEWDAARGAVIGEERGLSHQM